MADHKFSVPSPFRLKLRLLALGPHHNHVVDIVYQAGPEAPGKQRSYHAGYSRAQGHLPGAGQGPVLWDMWSVNKPSLLSVPQLHCTLAAWFTVHLLLGSR